MTSSQYAMPPRRERALSELLAKAQHQIEQLLKDSSGALVIEELTAENKRLVDEVAALDRSLKSHTSKNGNLVSRNKELKALASTRNKKLASLCFDVKVAHCLWSELKREYEKTEEKRFKWAECARRLGRDLTLAKAEIRKLKTLLNRSPENSSLPPSQDPNRKKVHNSREKTGRKPGGQLGHVGHTRRLHTPDEFVVLNPPLDCPSCGGTLKVHPPTHRQITELLITTKTTNYAASKCTCKQCGCHVDAPFPEGLVNEANYGNNVRAISTFMVNRCNVSKANTVRFLLEASEGKLALSTGSVQNFLRDFELKAQSDIEGIIASLGTSAVIASDATHTRSSGQKSYIYTYNTPHETLFLASDKKGIAPLKASPLASYEGTLVHDHDKSYYHFGTRHGECNVHTLRYLKGIVQNEPERRWARRMRSLLCEANDAVKIARKGGLSSLPPADIAIFETRYDAVIALAEDEYMHLEHLPAKYRPEGIALYTRLKNYRSAHLAFLDDFQIPFDNNASERMLRKAKGKLKQSGGFRSTENGQAYYCTYLTITETARLRNKDPLAVVRSIFNGESGSLVADDP